MPEENDPLLGALSQMAAAAAGVHEMFTEFVKAGFTRTEALQLVVAMSSGGMQGNGS